jgi:hypothetical protein
MPRGPRLLGRIRPAILAGSGTLSATWGIIPRPGRDLGPPDPHRDHAQASPDPDRDRAQGTPDPGRDLGGPVRINRGNGRGPWARFTFREGQELEGQELEGQELEELEGQELEGVR